MTKEELLQIPFYIEDISGSENTVIIQKGNSSAPTLNLEYSTDGITWTTKTMNSDTTANTFTVPANGKLYLRGVNNQWSSTSSSYDYYNTITCSGNHNVGGNIMSLLYGSDFIGKTTFPTTNNYVLYSLFNDNTTLVNAQDLQLPATTLVDYCYYYMFAACSSLTTAPELPATTLAQYCYSNMFAGCSSLTKAPSILPATTLAQYCYNNMFWYCKSLTTTPELPATTLTTGCYQYMFQDCTSLTTASELPATTLTNNCYYYMFSGCSKLNYIKADFINYDSYYLSNWVSGVSSTGTFVMNPNATYNPDNIRGNNGIPSGWSVCTSNQRVINISSNNRIYGTVSGSGAYNLGETITITAVPTYKSKFVSWSDGLTEHSRTIEITEDLPYVIDYTAIFEKQDGLFFINNSENINTLTVTNSNKNLQYSFDNINWYVIESGKSTIEFKDGVSIKGNNTSLDGVNFKNSEFTSIEGKLLILLYGDDVETMDNVIPENSINTFKGLFKNNTNLIDNSNLVLPENTTKGCYTYMFQGCTNLGISINIEIPLSEIYFYIEDISGSENTISITKSRYDAPTLNLEYSYDQTEWTSVTMDEDIAPNTFTCPANSRIYFRGVNDSWGYGNDHYSVYNTIFVENFYKIGGNSMSLLYGNDFEDKTSFPSYNQYTFANLFYDNDTLVDSRDLSLPATTLTNYCYRQMFYNCTSLITAPELPATTVAYSCYSNMFYNCTSLTTAPSILPATTLDSYCYYNMFYYCSSLTTAPALPATTLVNRCYQYMFYYCSNLNYIKADFINYSNEYGELSYWVDGVSSTGTFVMNTEATYNPENIRGRHGIPSRWTVVYSDNNNDNNNEVPNTNTTTITIEYNNITILPATELAPNCYHHMFTSCKSLKTIPELPAQNLTNSCYHGMFMDCDGIDKVTLPETYLAPYAYSNMFLGSHNLSDVTVTYKEDVDETNYKGWLNGVSINGEFKYNHTEEVDDTLIRSNYYVPSTWGVTKTE